MKKVRKASPQVAPILSCAAISVVFGFIAQLRHHGVADMVSIQYRNISYIFLAILFIILARLQTDNRRMAILAAVIGGGILFSSLFPFLRNELLGHGLIAKYIH